MKKLGATDDPAVKPVAFLYGDYACPHSYLANARLEVLASEASLTIVWRPLAAFDPELSGDWRGLSEDPSDLESCVEALSRDAAQLGLPFRLPASPPSTQQAFQASEFARDCGSGAFRSFHTAVFRAVFSEGLDIGDPLVLARVADQAGIDQIGLAAALEDGRYESSLEEVESEATRYGITSTPTVLLGKWKLVGAAPVDVLRSTLARVSESPQSASTCLEGC
jgi:predicted DsbA family dithiol-disulfide isomerase